MNQEIIIKQLFRDSIEEQVLLVHAFNPSLDIEQCSREWQNKHYKNPLGDSIIFGAYFNGKLVGINAYMPVEYNQGGKKYAMLQSCDSKVLEESRGHGIWSKIVRTAVDYIFSQTEYVAIVGFPNYRNSYPGFIKMKWQTVEHMNNYVLVNTPSLFSKILFKKRWMSLLFGGVTGFQRLRVALMRTGCLQITICKFNELIWDDTEECLCISHTNELLEWKHMYKSIETISVRENGRVIGSCIYSFDKFKGFLVCRIEKFVTVDCSGREEKRIFASILKYIRQHVPQAAMVRVWTMSDNELESLCRKTLFVKSKHPNPFIVKQPLGMINDRKWNLSFFDLD